MEEVEMEVDAVKCSDQLTRLRQQWQGDRTAQLHAMMSECFRKEPIQSGKRFSSETEETVVQETSYEESPKRKKKATHQNEVTSPSADATRAETPLSPEPALVPNVPPAPTVCQHEVPELLEQPDSVSPQPAEQETPSVRKGEVQAVDVEEFPQQDRIMRALEKRSEQLGRLAQSHRQLADVSHKLLEALLDQQGKILRKTLIGSIHSVTAIAALVAMFKRFSVDEHVSTSSKVKSSQQRSIRSKVLEQYPDLESYAEMFMPKKAPMVVAKCHNHIQIVLHEGEPLFFNQRDGPFMPTLKLLHKMPHVMKQVRADKGAIPFVLSGANVMCPGLTSAGGDMPEPLEAGTPVAIMAEGKEHAMAIGILSMSTDDIRNKSKGVAIEMVHFLGDDLWTCSHID
ncbi:uncharacterized protein PITG_17779 [Phytophthora infestans T30-4]|uniref:PUA domain-containing protein n=3 Tax=Phytophthora infestans TaxID=4787 RepID=D0NW91_PHYIT|nr:uncharacterized protein PITG_17779 [Phytophthora infestans T30-4]EEY66908.1 conserved hypothetical protein [Phytophthora infestans T30-4]|eukprot:XP_002896626.1 conserved hypothetical protein [Phytophthora infestans T30-4]